MRCTAPTAESGAWVAGPGRDLFDVVDDVVGGLPFVAEDLGIITPDVSILRDVFQLAGTRVLQFAFDGNAGNPHLPDNYVHNSVVYTGTMLTWLSFGEALGFVGLGLIGLIAHELRTERVVHQYEAIPADMRGGDRADELQAAA